VGLVKFDFLGLKNLTVIDRAVRLIRAGKDPSFDIAALRDDDQASYELISSGNTTGIFQLESSGMKEMLVKLKPSCFEDVIAACALYRPGPLGSGMVDDFIERKHGRRKVVYDLPQLEPILKDTYGVIVYQEQVMQISRTLAGYSLGRADLLRRAMGKKDPAVMAKEKEPFLEGAKANGVDLKRAEAIFDLMAKFAEYGFNKSHSAAYALIAYQTAYLKAHYPVEFMAALLTCDMGNTDKVVKNISDCREMGIEVVPPDVNGSDLSFRVLDNAIRFGLGAIKNVGEGAIESILESRESGPFTDIFDFCERVDLRRVNKRVLEALIRSGSFDSTGSRRSQLMDILEDAMAYGQRVQAERESAQVSLFGDEHFAGGSATPRPPLADLPEWDEKLRLSFEKEALGFYVSGHPLNRYASEMRRLATAENAAIGDCPDKSQVKVCGLVAALKETMTKKGDRMGFVTLEDLSGPIELVIFSELYQQVSELLKGEEPLLATGTVDIGEKSVKVIANEICRLTDAAQQATKRVLIRLNAPQVTREQLQSLRGVISRNHGDCPTLLTMEIPGECETVIRLPAQFTVTPTERLATEARTIFGYNAVVYE
jgi:DNA polymerase-3 subunit alpha